MERNRFWRRNQTSKAQSKRFHELRDYELSSTLENPRRLGKLKNNHFGCSCPLCKPHKFGLDDKLPHSQRKKL